MKRMSPIHPISNATGEVELVSREEQMEIYDSLPLSWRILVGTLPSATDLRMVKQFLEILGEEDGMREIVRQFRTKYPGWSPMS